MSGRLSGNPAEQASFSAVLLDLNDPRMVLGRPKDPLIASEEPERRCLVPKVVHGCGSLDIRDTLNLPCTNSDLTTTRVRMKLEDLRTSPRGSGKQPSRQCPQGRCGKGSQPLRIERYEDYRQC